MLKDLRCLFYERWLSNTAAQPGAPADAAARRARFGCILTVGISPTAFLLDWCGAAQRQAVGPQPSKLHSCEAPSDAIIWGGCIMPPHMRCSDGNGW
jgi:hypothetical protein